MLIPNSLFMIDVNAVIISNLPLFVKGKVSTTANSVMESASSGTRHVLAYARAANLTRVILTGSFANVLHPDESWVPIVATEEGKVIERLRSSRTNLLVLDWNPQTPDEVKKLGLHPWCMHTAARVTAERELWKFSDANPNIDVTSSTFPFPFPSIPLPLLTPALVHSPSRLRIRAIWPRTGDRSAPYRHLRLDLCAFTRAARPANDPQRPALLSELRPRSGRCACPRCGAADWPRRPAAAQTCASRRGVCAVARGHCAPRRGDARDQGAASEPYVWTGTAGFGVRAVRDEECKRDFRDRGVQELERGDRGCRERLDEGGFENADASSLGLGLSFLLFLFFFFVSLARGTLIHLSPLPHVNTFFMHTLQVSSI